MSFLQQYRKLPSVLRCCWQGTRRASGLCKNLNVGDLSAALCVCLLKLRLSMLPSPSSHAAAKCAIALGRAVHGFPSVRQIENFYYKGQFSIMLFQRCIRVSTGGAK